MKGLLLFSGIWMMLALALTGCEKGGTEQVEGQATEVANTQIQLCSHCGQIQGGEKCCQPGATKCSSCSLVKGSPACCKQLDFSQGPVILCDSCGQVKGSDACCAKDAPKCEKCNLAKGSPGCCKIAI